MIGAAGSCVVNPSVSLRRLQRDLRISFVRSQHTLEKPYSPSARPSTLSILAFLSHRGAHCRCRCRCRRVRRCRSIASHRNVSGASHRLASPWRACVLVAYLLPVTRTRAVSLLRNTLFYCRIRPHSIHSLLRAIDSPARILSISCPSFALASLTDSWTSH